jgi:hypothetical protein
VATFRILTYVRPEGSGFHVSVTSVRADVEHSIPLSDGEVAEAQTREEAFRLRSELLNRLLAKIQQRGDTTVQIREIGDLEEKAPPKRG